MKKKINMYLLDRLPVPNYELCHILRFFVVEKITLINTRMFKWTFTFKTYDLVINNNGMLDIYIYVRTIFSF